MFSDDRARKPRAGLEDDARLLRIHRHRPEASDNPHVQVVQLADEWVFALEVIRDPVARAGVPYVAGHEAVAAVGARPEGSLFGGRGVPSGN